MVYDLPSSFKHSAQLLKPPPLLSLDLDTTTVDRNCSDGGGRLSEQTRMEVAKI